MGAEALALLAGRRGCRLVGTVDMVGLMVMKGTLISTLLMLRRGGKVEMYVCTYVGLRTGTVDDVVARLDGVVASSGSVARHICVCKNRDWLCGWDGSVIVD